MTDSFYGITSNNIKKFIELGFEKGFMDPNEFIEYLIKDEKNKKYISTTQIQWTQLITERKYKELDHENTLLKVANAELRDRLEILEHKPSFVPFSRRLLDKKLDECKSLKEKLTIAIGSEAIALQFLKSGCHILAKEQLEKGLDKLNELERNSKKDSTNDTK